MRYLERAADRLHRERDAAFRANVAAVQIGTVIAHDKKALTRWQSKAQRSEGPGRGSHGLTGEALERAVMSIAAMNPTLVALPGQPVRRMSRRISPST